VDADRSPRNVRVVPDLGDELLIAIDRLEALLGSVAVWEIEDDVGLPAPFADGKALGALQTVRDGYGYGSAAVVAGGGSGLVEAAEQRAGRRVLAAMLGDMRARRPRRISATEGPISCGRAMLGAKVGDVAPAQLSDPLRRTPPTRTYRIRRIGLPPFGLCQKVCRRGQ